MPPWVGGSVAGKMSRLVGRAKSGCRTAGVRHTFLPVRTRVCRPARATIARATSHRTQTISDSASSILARIGRPSIARRIALVDDGGSWSYSDLMREAAAWRDRLAETRCRAGDRIAYLSPPGRSHVAAQLGIWAGGAIAVPLAVSHPRRELDYVLGDARPRTVLVDPSLPRAPDLTASANARGVTVVALPSPPASAPRGEPSPLRAPADAALIIYTSGTTGRPKGVLTTHRNLAAQITALTSAWGWTAADRILHTLPLHHIHGVVNALACALWSGATCEFGSGTPISTWDRLASGEITLFMSVPTVYTRLIRAWDEAPAGVRQRWSRGAARLRLMVSGSAALPVATLERWREITGHTLLERYGMTEIGMALSNPLTGERRPGHVGLPLPGVELRIVDDDGRPVEERRRQGEIEVRGPQVFREYWGRPAETAAAFRRGWFRTGDEACLDEGGYCRILGRRSVDIVKTGGYKVSALEVEELYRAHPAIRDLAVVGVPHREWGEQLRAAWVPDAAARVPDAPARLPSSADLRSWGKERLAPYKVPQAFTAVPALPRNAMGKVRKAAVSRMLTDSETGSAPETGPAPASHAPKEPA